ncbi:MAG: NAD(P)H-dependent oxidoreductase [Candidatus Thiodiazotropha sp. (ex Ctena orbiculata)]|nr:NAD(P)H-dependent oxidoreductase [Candidatus Thiodiazotropha taylori]PUB81583.1 MAG: NADPH-dependent FMN reductase [gamma proteobacterium symbiont of Ctena orbiculata]MBT2998627.1 NAD(P)H-dependent oxidoreductase [Candidatus Thiodiazotropha taylori]MBT3001457.1 NAD(P)H-dependent oxidoreductase [Candidatus Thiodiazotropha taylori]MBV2106105.1 NAD(P)H-dependent oxidoreductase [Candidatus Thiodiazotropha taylori]
MKLLAFAASSSKKSINKRLATYAGSLLDDAETEILDLNDYELPLFSVDREEELGHPQLAKAFLAKIAASDALIISFAEHNGSYTSAYKNLFDWCSRISNKVYDKKPVVLLSASPGAKGGESVLAVATASMPFFGASVMATLSIPNFYQNFDLEKGVLTNQVQNAKLIAAVETLK